MLIPGFGDALSAAAMLPGLYVSAFKLHSLRLTLAIFCCGMIDLLVGCIPMLGDLVDAFYKSNKIAARLFIGYVEDDPDTLTEINKKSGWGIVILSVLVLIMYSLYETIMTLHNWIATLLN